MQLKAREKENTQENCTFGIWEIFCFVFPVSFARQTMKLRNALTILWFYCWVERKWPICCFFFWLDFFVFFFFIFLFSFKCLYFCMARCVRLCMNAACCLSLSTYKPYVCLFSQVKTNLKMFSFCVFCFYFNSQCVCVRSSSPYCIWNNTSHRNNSHRFIIRNTDSLNIVS